MQLNLPRQVKTNTRIIFENFNTNMLDIQISKHVPAPNNREI